MMKIKISLLVLCTIILTGCYTPKEDVFVEDLDLVVVDYDDAFNFGEPRTYFMPDSISRVQDTDDGDLTDDYDDLVLDEIRANMAAYGWQAVDDANVGNADVVLLISAVRVNTYIIGDPCFWGCWGWYPWPPGWGWGPGYGWPYPPPVLGSYSKGTVFMNMVDPSEPSQGPEIDQIWMGAVNGLLQGSDESILERTGTLINKAFELSPYLQR